ncbi:MAG: DUF1015 domain-containing protein, partial [Saprospiraceae bacterium]|nr:DUF1015 domain-containing protein [Saprospiraceae bacterium]
HRLWKISDPAEIEALTTLFDQYVPKVYIADGHHRSACSALLYRRLQEKKETGITSDRFLCGLFPESELEILAFNRIVQLPDELDEETLLQRLAEVCTIKLLKRKRQPPSKHEMTMIVGDHGYSLKWKPEFLDPHASLSEMLDTALLNKHILKNILGITDIRTDRRVSYTEGPKGLRAITRRIHEDPRCIAFCLYPISAEEFFAVADAGEVLPPKSTWFEPRMKNGLLVQEL